MGEAVVEVRLSEVTWRLGVEAEVRSLVKSSRLLRLLLRHQ